MNNKCKLKSLKRSFVSMQEIAFLNTRNSKFSLETMPQEPPLFAPLVLIACLSPPPLNIQICLRPFNNQLSNVNIQEKHEEERTTIIEPYYIK